MDVTKPRREDYRNYRSRSRSRVLSASHSPVSDHSRHRHHHHHHHHHHHNSSNRHARSRSPEKNSRKFGRRKHEKREADIPVDLPFGSRQLSKHDLRQLMPMFALYLDIQKNLDVAELDEREVKGRWKSFVGKWNRGELAEGWYDPTTFEKAQQNSASGFNDRESTNGPRASPAYDEYYERSSGKNTSEPPGERSNSAAILLSGKSECSGDGDEDEDEDEDEEESYGPKFPARDTSLAMEPSNSRSNRAVQKSGPTIPTVQDLQLQRESEKQSQTASLAAQHKQTTLARTSHKALVRAAEEEIAPRAEPGTRERRLEKKREAAAANRAFADAKWGGDDDGVVGDEELMGAGSDLAQLKKEKEKLARKKNERELRREETLRARAAEREERLKSYRRREEETMSVLKALAKQRYG
ncbi:hypothetical protein PABG_02171 [Paracoccidioides brasiliensis Pb03]|nr:hypothetical protein PABG_02171 [Paracoccidioides brasiliensis Pb03]